MPCYNMRRLLSFTAASVALSFVGCSNGTVRPLPAVAGMSGSIHGGQQPISGATIQIYTVGIASDGSAATPLLTGSVLSDASGNFNITGLYTCPSASSLVYIVGSGGSPIASILNPQIALMAALGPCGNLTPTTFININEITTVAAVYALAPFTTSFSAIGSGPSDASSLAQAFTSAGYLANTTTGTTPGTNLPANYSVPIAQVNTIADLLAACINSPGGVSGDTSICGQFFALTLPSGATAPTDTIAALLNLANNPTQNTASLYNLIPPSSPFQPVQPIIPPDFALRPLVNSLFTVSPSTVSFASAVVDFSQPLQTITVTNGTPAAITITSAYLTGVNASDFALVPPPGSTCLDTVPANSSCVFQITFTPSAAGARAAYFVLGNTSANSSIAIALAGTGTAGSAGPVTLSPSSLTFSSINAPQPLTLTNNGSSTLTINAIRINGNNYATSGTCGTSLAASTACTINVYPNASSASPAATLTVVDDAAAGPQSANLTFTASSAPTFPSTIDFGHWALGASTSQYLQIVGPGVSGGYNYSISGPNASDFSLSTTAPVSSGSCSFDYRNSSGCYLTIAFTPSALGTRTASFTIPGFPAYTLTGTVDPAGVDFDLFQKPTAGTFSTLYVAPVRALNVGSSVLGTPVTSSFNVTSTGTVPITYKTPVLSGPNASDFAFAASCASPCGSIVFTPSAPGTRTATATYIDSTNTITRTVALTGTGTTPAPVLTSTNSLLFTNVPVGTTSASQTITVTAYNNDPIQASLASVYTGGPQPFVFTGPNSCAATPCQLSVAYSPAAADASKGIENVYVIATDTLGQSSGNIQLAGQVAPYAFVHISPTSLTFAAQALHTSSAAQTITLTNTGSIVLNLTFSVSPYTADYPYTTNCPASLPINATCTVSVTFAPVTTTGTLNSTLIISGANTTQYVSLSGTAF